MSEPGGAPGPEPGVPSHPDVPLGPFLPNRVLPTARTLELTVVPDGMPTDWTLAAIREMCAREGATLEVAIQAIHEAMTEAEYPTKDGGTLPDHGTRLKASTVLLNLLQVPYLTKEAARKEAKGGMMKDLATLVRERQAKAQP